MNEINKKFENYTLAEDIIRDIFDININMNEVVVTSVS